MHFDEMVDCAEVFMVKILYSSQNNDKKINKKQN